MSDHKRTNLDPRYKKELSGDNGSRSYGSALAERNKLLTDTAGKDVGGWDAYRRWLTRVQAPEKRRVPLDPNLYTWKGYRSWSEKVRRDWDTD